MNENKKVLLDFDCTSLSDSVMQAEGSDYPHFYFADAKNEYCVDVEPGTIRLGSDGQKPGYCMMQTLLPSGTTPPFPSSCG